MRSFDRRTKIILIFAFISLCAVVYGLIIPKTKKNDSLISSSAGKIVNRSNDVRRKSELDVSWNQIPNQEKVFNQDHIFTGERSSAEIELKTGAKVSMNSNSLIVLKDQKDRSEVKQSTGGFISRLRRGEKFNLVKNNKVIQLSAGKEDTTIQVNQTNEDSDLGIVVLSGQLQVEDNGKVLELKKNEELVFANVPTLAPRIIKYPVRLLEPKSDETVHVDQVVQAQSVNRKLSSVSENERSPEPPPNRKILPSSSESKTETAAPQKITNESVKNDEPTIKREAVSSKDRKIIEQLFYFWLGFGANFISSAQTDTDGTDLSFQSTPSASHFLKVGGFVSKDIPGLEFSYKQSPGSVASSSDVSVINGQYRWETFASEALFLVREDEFDPAKLDKTVTARLGIQHHFIPYFATQPSGSVDVRRNSVTNASLGFELVLGAKHKVRYEFLGRYQYPIVSAADGGNTFSVTPKFAFDGSIGIASNLNKNMILGAYWYGQWNQYGFSYYDKVNSTSNSGRQSLFYTNMEIRLGYIFE